VEAGAVAQSLVTPCERRRERGLLPEFCDVGGARRRPVVVNVRPATVGTVEMAPRG